MRVLVCGGRKYDDVAVVHEALDALVREHGPWITVINGGAGGADRLARTWARLHYQALVTVDADWHRHGTAAGPIRNAEMLREAKPDLVLAFPGGRGTADMVRKARDAGVEVREMGQ